MKAQQHPEPDTSLCPLCPPPCTHPASQRSPGSGNLPCPYQLMHFLRVNNKEPLVEAQRCGHTTGLWLQANDICEGNRGSAEGRWLGGRPGTSCRPLLIRASSSAVAEEPLNTQVRMRTPRRCLQHQRLASLG